MYIDIEVVDSPVVRAIKSRLNLPGRVVEKAEDVYRQVRSASDPIQAGKETLFLTKNRGPFIRSCPGTRAYRCCGYKILHIGTFCSLDCSYCILQSYFHPPVLQYFVNHSDLIDELEVFLSSEKIQRIGTGEFTDSLIWEPWFPLSAELIDRFAHQSHAVLELKTKTTNIQGLKNLPHNQKTIVAWSVNSEYMISGQERHTASLEERVMAAATCERWGYPLAFHFDPLIVYDGCIADYQNVVDRLFSAVSPSRLVWISLGAFRFTPPLKPLIQRRFPDSTIPYGEFIPGKDGKMRYFKPIRIELFRAVVDRIRKWAPEVLIYLCMEDDEVWEKTLGFRPFERAGLSHMLDRRAAQVCKLSPQ
ncbi:MAG: DNA photolyase [Deltaproteobacteria bacterium]|nr:DNA photolyase [Deltaproteobacteria bacterium]MBW1992938.1 DNA photolyase [Deltaproteobacteria bacterium]MBW2152806.1 DNA photolyase [Deltaproteobacteria bacterium]